MCQRIFVWVLTVMRLEAIWKLYLLVRQRRVYQRALQVPHELTGILDPTTFNKSRLYGLDYNSLGIVKEVYKIIINTLILLYGLIPHIWELTAAITVGYFEVKLLDEILHSHAFTFLFDTICFLSTLPFSVYAVFVIEEAYGFNKQTFWGYVSNTLMNLIVNEGVVFLLTEFYVILMRTCGNWAFIWMWILKFTVFLFEKINDQNYIAPLPQEYKRLEKGILRTKIDTLATKLNFPLTELFIEESKRSSHSTAYLSGFSKHRRIVISDTLIKSEGSGERGCDDDEVLGVLAHELGHWKYSHIPKKILFYQVALLLQFATFQIMFSYQPMYQAFGFSDQPVVIGMKLALEYVFVTYDTLMDFAMTLLNRRFELQADLFAKSLGQGQGMRRALVTIDRDNLEFPVSDWLYSMWHHDHPTLMVRLNALGKQD